MPQKFRNIQKFADKISSGIPSKPGWRVFRRTFLKKVWVVVLLLAIISLIAACSSQTLVTPTRFIPIPTPSSPTVTRTPTPVPTSTIVPIPVLEPLVIPTSPPGGTLLTLSPESNFTGWVSNRESGISMGDFTLRAGIFQGQPFSSLLRFDLRNLAPGSRIVFGVLELTGSASTNLGAGEWILDLLDSNTVRFDNLTLDNLKNAKKLSTIGAPLTAKDLAVGLTNRFIFASNDLAQVEKQLDNGILTLRLNGPSTGDNNLFTWNAGPTSKLPTLYIVTIPAQFVVITNTPAPNNVFAAATLSANQTQLARQSGTATPLPRIFATATPGGSVAISNPNMVITTIPTPSDPIQVTATALYATAVAATTGTFTPMPSYIVTATPPPVFIPIERLTPLPTPTPNTAQPSTLELAKLPLPAGLYNKILFLEGPRSNPNIWLMNPDGTILGLVTDRTVSDIAKARETISSDGVHYVYQAVTPDGSYQLLMKDLNFPNALPSPIAIPSRSTVVFGQAWAPDASKFAFVAEELNHQEIYEYTLANRSSKKLTTNPDGFFNQYPSYSPDGKQIVYSSDRGHASTFAEIWLMSADGTNQTKLGNGTWDAYNPVWIKWQK